MMHYKVLADYINEHNIKTFVELGVKDGRTTRYLLENTQAFIYGVDLWELVPDNDAESYKTWNHQSNKLKAMSLLDEYPDRVKMFQVNTIKAAELIPSVDMVFIDADHSYDGVKADVKAWESKCKILSGHDIDWETTRKAVAASFDYHILEGSNVWIRLP